jgi:hypothetical protein
MKQNVISRNKLSLVGEKMHKKKPKMKLRNTTRNADTFSVTETLNRTEYNIL